MAALIARVPTGAGEYIKARRVAAKVSQQALADRMKELGLPWHQTTVAKTESGERPLRVDELVALGVILHAKQLDELLGDDLRDRIERHRIKQSNAAYRRAEERKRRELAELGDDAVLEYERTLKEQRQIQSDQFMVIVDAMGAIATMPEPTEASLVIAEAMREMGRRARLGKPEEDDDGEHQAPA